MRAAAAAQVVTSDDDRAQLHELRPGKYVDVKRAVGREDTSNRGGGDESRESAYDRASTKPKHQPNTCDLRLPLNPGPTVPDRAISLQCKVHVRFTAGFRAASGAWTAGRETRSTGCRTRSGSGGAETARRRTTQRPSSPGLRRRERSAKIDRTSSSGPGRSNRLGARTGSSPSARTSRTDSRVRGPTSELRRRRNSMYPSPPPTAPYE